MTRRNRSNGFTLMEVMIALAVLAGALSVLVRTSATSAQASLRATRITAATALARGKMYDVEERLADLGFEDGLQEEEGDFGEEGSPDITWALLIEPIELPSGDTVRGLLSEQEEGAEGAQGVAGGALQGIMGSLPAGMQAGMGDIASSGNLQLLLYNFEVVKTILEKSLRRVTVTVKWKVSGREEELVVSCYYSSPKAVDGAIREALAALPTPPASGARGPEVTP